MKEQPTNWDILTNDSADKGLIFKIYKDLIQLNTKTNDAIFLKMGKGPEKTFLSCTYRWQIDLWKDVNQQMLIIREMLSKAPMKYHLTSVRMSIINKSTNNQCWWGCREKGTLVHCWWNCKWCSHYGKTVGKILKKLKIELPYDPVIPVLGI